MPGARDPCRRRRGSSAAPPGARPASRRTPPATGRSRRRRSWPSGRIALPPPPHRAPTRRAEPRTRRPTVTRPCTTLRRAGCLPDLEPEHLLEVARRVDASGNTQTCNGSSAKARAIAGAITSTSTAVILRICVTSRVPRSSAPVLRHARNRRASCGSIPSPREWVNVVGHRQARPNLPTTGCPFCRRWARSARAVRRALVPEPLALARTRRPRSTSRPPTATATRPCCPRSGRAKSCCSRREHDASLAHAAGRPGAQGRRPVGRAHDGAPRAPERSSTCSCSRTAAARSARRSTIRTDRSTAIHSCHRHRRAKRRLRAHTDAACARRCERSSRRMCASSTGAATGSRTSRALRRIPYGMRFASRDHVGGLPDLDDPARDDLATLLGDALGRYDRLWPSPEPGYLFPYLLWFHQAPATGGDEWHVHAHTAPPLRAAGSATLRGFR